MTTTAKAIRSKDKRDLYHIFDSTGTKVLYEIESESDKEDKE